jgi:CRISPR-associated protein Csm5
MKPSRRRYRLTALSPVHVGNGEFLVRDVDYLEDEGKTYVLDVERLFELLAVSPGALDEYSSGRADLRRLLDRLRVRPERIASWAYSGRLGVPRVQLLARNARGQPLLPGTAVKGALRTLVVWALSFDFDEGARDWVPSREAAAAVGPAIEAASDWDSRPGDAVERSILWAPAARRHGGHDHSGDLLRCLGVGDCIVRDTDLEVARVRVLTATPEGPAWKAAERGARARPRPDDPEAASLGVEALRPGASGNLTLRFDELYELLRGEAPSAERRLFEAARAELDFEPWRIDIPFQVAIHSRNLGLALCYRERRFYEERKLYDLARFYVDLEQKIQKAAGSEAIFARLGWGGGWEAMTGGIAHDRARERARQRFGLGREGYPFPKSRKLMLEGSKAVLPFGWVRLDPLTAAA